MQPGMRLHGISPGGETALFLNQERAAYVALKDGSFNTVRRFRENPAGPRGDIYLHPDGKSYLTFYADDLIVATIDGGQVTFRVDLPESDQYVRIFPLFSRDAAMYFTGTPGDYALRMINLKTGAIGDKHELNKRVTDLSSLHAMPRNDGVITATAAGAVIISIPRGNTGKLELGPGESPAFYLPRTDVMVVNGPGTIRLWDMATKVDLANFKPHPETATRNGVPTASARAIATEDGQTLITVGENGALKFWRLRQ